MIECSNFYEYHSHLVDRLNSARPFQYKSQHFFNGDRRLIVDWILSSISHLGLSCQASHLAIFLFDHFINEHAANRQGLYLIAAGCLSLAAKIEELEVNIPYSSKVLRLIPDDKVLCPKFLTSIECLIMTYFEGDLHFPTEAIFLDIYVALCLKEDMLVIQDNSVKCKLESYFRKWIRYFREKVLGLDGIRLHSASSLAAAIVIASRFALALTPDWSYQLASFTGISKHQVSPLVDCLLGLWSQDAMVEKAYMLHPHGSLSSPLSTGSVGSSCPTTPGSPFEVTYGPPAAAAKHQSNCIMFYDQPSMVMAAPAFS